MEDIPQEPMGNDIPQEPMGNDMSQEPIDNEEDGFDAGVEADPVEDPEKYIQQLTGKLSQELRSYNNDQEEPDTELNKYVAGMIIPQTVKDMTNRDKKEIIGKIKKNNVDDIEDSNNEEDEDSNIDGDEDNMPMESINRLESIVTEIVNSLNDDEKHYTKRKEKKIDSRDKTINPFISKY